MNIDEQIIESVKSELTRLEPGIHQYIIDVLGVSIDVLSISYTMMITVSSCDGLLTVSARRLDHTKIDCLLPYRQAWELAVEQDVIGLAVAAVQQLHRGRCPR